MGEGKKKWVFRKNESSRVRECVCRRDWLIKVGTCGRKRIRVRWQTSIKSIARGVFYLASRKRENRPAFLPMKARVGGAAGGGGGRVWFPAQGQQQRGRDRPVVAS